MVVLILVAITLVWQAKNGFDELGATSQRIVDVYATQRATGLVLGMAINEATIQEKNIISETRPEALTEYVEGFNAAKARALEAANNLIEVATNPERRARNEELKREVESFFEVSGRTVDLARQGMTQDAFRLSAGEGRTARKNMMARLNEGIVANQEEIQQAKAESAELASSTTSWLVGLAAVGLLSAVAALAAVIVFGVTKPLSRITSGMGRLAQGDLDVSVEGAERKDEIGALAKALDVFKANALEARRLTAEQQAENEAKMRRAAALDALTKEFENKVTALTQGLSSAATEMEATAQSMTGIADQANTQTMTVASAAGQASANVQTVAAASEELAASIQEITSQVASSSRIAGKAQDDAKRTDATVRSLASQTEKIGSVVALINDIAGQTNLLALNATIEAARAGEAGRGFAVVAAEVKELAGQTSKATEEIGAQISEIQNATQDVVAVIQEIAATIGEMAAISTSVAAAMEQQGAATQEIARNVQEAARGTEQVTGSIERVRQGAGETGAAASQVLTSAQELARHSSSLGAEVGSFLAGVKAA
ncbi:hypothetical protein GCM10011322_42630 [Salinarimonas ramus]|uniref:Methyl-accepting chemotaxis protein n=1 Tax=Salinarimonas ramus TaxID=690164 RepID=A0A917QIS1_9HYPH|nr:hypothetical protein GCM10011322_42630 [Salinarimonas ramus]